MARTERLRHLPKLRAKKFIDGNLRHKYREIEEQIERHIVHEIYQLPCVLGQKWITYPAWKNNEPYTWRINNHISCATRARVYIPWTTFRDFRNNYLFMSAASVVSHPYARYGHGSRARKFYRTQNNRKLRRKVKLAERLSVHGVIDEDQYSVEFPRYKNCVQWEMW